MAKMEALVELRYGGKTLKPGDEFEARDKDVVLLKGIRKAKDVPEKVPTTQKPPEPRKVETQALKPEPPADENPNEVRLRRTYRRRDLTSEE